ncbi:hypothetical protein EIQ23_21250 [Xanthomonas campestris pv. campestris]
MRWMWWCGPRRRRIRRCSAGNRESGIGNRESGIGNRESMVSIARYALRCVREPQRGGQRVATD